MSKTQLFYTDFSVKKETLFVRMPLGGEGSADPLTAIHIAANTPKTSPSMSCSTVMATSSPNSTLAAISAHPTSACASRSMDRNAT